MSSFKNYSLFDYDDSLRNLRNTKSFYQRKKDSGKDIKFNIEHTKSANGPDSVTQDDHSALNYSQDDQGNTRCVSESER